MITPKQARSIATASALSLLLFFPAAQAQQKAAPPTSEALIAARDLLDASGAGEQMDVVLPSMTAQMANIFVQQHPQHERTIRESFATMATRMSQRKVEIIEEIAAVYARKFTIAEMKEVAQFLSTGVGKKFVDSQPEIVQESMALGQRWGARIGQEIDAEMRKELRAKGVPI